MKLNNHGWGIKEMLVLSAILIFFFALAIYFIYIFYNSLAKEITNVNNVDISQYEMLEKKLLKNGEEYLKRNTNNYQNGDTILINELVRAQYSEFIFDPVSGDLCDAYIKVLDVEEFLVSSFIRCSYYQTSGFEE